MIQYKPHSTKIAWYHIHIDKVAPDQLGLHITWRLLYDKEKDVLIVTKLSMDFSATSYQYFSINADKSGLYCRYMYHKNTTGVL